MSDAAGPTVFCAWCRRVIAWGQTGVAHAICPDCLPAVADAVEAQLARRDDGRRHVPRFRRTPHPSPPR
ncbi:MAG: hypothetical protein IT304_11775 [Dehalococcoidia bacterium]|nr:hypothetical protein [Dehalococcoidia bacterium]